MSNIQEIKISILQIGDARITFKPNIKNYLFKGKSPRELPTNYYTDLYKTFNTNLLIELREGCTVDSLNSLVKVTKKTIKTLRSVSDSHRVSFVLLRSKKELSLEAESTHVDINSILSTQKSVLNKILLRLYDEIDLIISNGNGELENNSDFSEIDSSPIPFSDSGKVTFKMSKKESLMLLFVLEQNNLIEFEDDNQRRKFIENNFNFTEVRKNKDEGKTFPMIGVSSEISKFRSLDRDELISNTKTLNCLLERLNNTIYEFEFKK
jgi:transcription initiation factor IIE alpha subunit